MGRAPCCEKVGLKKGPWTPQEDQKLIAYIRDSGHGNWRTLPKKAGLLRCGKSCRLRWTNYLRPDIKRGRFSLTEEQLIIHLHALLGNRWSAIASHLPKRTDNEIKNFWNTHLKKRLVNLGIDPTTHKPKPKLQAPTNHLSNDYDYVPGHMQVPQPKPHPFATFWLSGMDEYSSSSSTSSASTYAPLVLPPSLASATSATTWKNPPPSDLPLPLPATKMMADTFLPSLLLQYLQKCDSEELEAATWGSHTSPEFKNSQSSTKSVPDCCDELALLLDPLYYPSMDSMDLDQLLASPNSSSSSPPIIIPPPSNSSTTTTTTIEDPSQEEDYWVNMLQSLAH